MNASAGCKKNHLPTLASPLLPTLCFSPGGEDTLHELKTLQRPSYGQNTCQVFSSPMRSFGSRCSSKLCAAVSYSLLSLILPRTSQAFCSLTLLYTDVQNCIRQSLPEPPGSNMNSQISLKHRCSETWRRSEQKRGKLRFGPR